MFWTSDKVSKVRDSLVAAIAKSMQHCGSLQIAEAQETLEKALMLQVPGSEKPTLYHGALKNYEVLFNEELLVFPSFVQLLCQVATFYSFFLCEYACGKLLFSKIFTPECLKAIINRETTQNFAFLEENSMNYAELICQRASEDEGITNTHIVEYITKKYQSNPKDTQAKRLYAKILIDRFVQSSKQNPEQDFDSDLLESFGIGVRLMIVSCE